MIKNVILVVLNVLWVSLSRCCLEIFRNMVVVSYEVCIFVNCRRVKGTHSVTWCPCAKCVFEVLP